MSTIPPAFELLSDIDALRGVIDAVPHPIFVKDADSRFLIVNETLCNLMGRTFAELIGKCDHDFFPAAEADVFLDNDRRVLEAGEINESEELFTDGDDLVRTIVTRKKRLVLSEGTRLLVGCITDISDFRRAEAAIRHNAEHDFLTGVANRSLFEKELDRAVTDSSEQRCSAALLVIDLDGFKSVNDALGHAAGDNILVQTAHSLSDLAGAPNRVARLGGDEFAVILYDARQPDAAEALARATVERLAKPTFVGRRRVAISASVGIAFAGDAPSDRETLLRRADLAMYAAKKEGRNRWKVFDRTMERSSVAA